MGDLAIYHESVRNVLDGQYLYGFEPSFTYPPFALWALLPFGLPLPLVEPLLHLGKMLLLHVGAWLYLGTRGLSERRRLWWSVAIAWAVAIFVDPVSQDIAQGQVNLLLLALVAADLLRPENPAGRRWYGVGVGVATGIKLVSGLFIVYLLVTRQFRAAAAATAAFLATVAFGFVTMPRASWAYWTDVLWDSSRVWKKPDMVLNQTVHGIVVRALGRDNTVLWLTLSVLVAVIGVALAAALHRRGAELAALSAVGMTAAAITPQGWIHHWVWVAPALLIVAVAAGRSVRAWLGVLALFTVACTRPYFMVGGDPWLFDARHLDVGRQLMAANLPLTAALLAGVAVLWLRRPADRLNAEPVPLARRELADRTP
jgi:alpha-1,2-mannosyltransferase